MADEYNPIEINNFPEISDLLSTDKIIVFEKTDNTLSPHLYNISDLSAVVVLPENTDDIKNKTNEVKSIINDAINYLKKNFVTKTDAEKLYGTIAELNTIIQKFETILDFENRIKNKADKEYLDRLANRVKANYNAIKHGLGTGDWDGGEGRGYKVLLVAKAGVKSE